MFTYRKTDTIVFSLNSSGTSISSGWLEAIPQPSLGQAIPDPKFVVDLRLWLGVFLFPFPLCVHASPP